MKELSNTQYQRYKILVFAISFIVLLSRALFVSCYDESRARNQIYGDGYSDINTISSAKYFYDSGFVKTAFLPVHDYYPKLLSPIVYTHYPAIPNILAGFYAVIFNSYQESVLRIVPLLMAVFFFFFIFHVLKQVTQNNTQAFIGGCSIALANYYIAWGDNLHQHLYGELLKWLYFYILYIYHKNGATNKWLFGVLLLIMIIEVNISFEQPVFLGILTLGFSIIFHKRIFTFETITAGLAVLVGFGLHVVQNAVYFGSFSLAIEDLKHALLFRTTGVEIAGQKAESAFEPSQYWQIPFNWFNRMERFYLLPGWSVIVLAYFALKNMKQHNLLLYKIIWALFFASIAWTFVMAQHAFIHTFTNKHFSIWYALVVAIGFPLFIEAFKQAWKMKQQGKVAFYTLLSLYMLAMFVTQQLIPVFFTFGLGYKL